MRGQGGTTADNDFDAATHEGANPREANVPKRVGREVAPTTNPTRAKQFLASFIIILTENKKVRLRVHTLDFVRESDIEDALLEVGVANLLLHALVNPQEHSGHRGPQGGLQHLGIVEEEARLTRVETDAASVPQGEKLAAEQNSFVFKITFFLLLLFFFISQKNAALFRVQKRNL